MITTLSNLAASKSRWGFWKRYGRFRFDGQSWNHKWFWRVCCQLWLNLPSWAKKRGAGSPPTDTDRHSTDECRMGVDFITGTVCGRCCFQTLNILDEDMREGGDRGEFVAAVKCVIRVQGRSWPDWGQSQMLRLDNGSDRIAEGFMTWRADRKIESWVYSNLQVDQNAFIEQCNLTHRTEVLNVKVCESLDQVRESRADAERGAGGSRMWKELP